MVEKSECLMSYLAHFRSGLPLFTELPRAKVFSETEEGLESIKKSRGFVAPAN
jgi:hypothetical protein